MVGNTTSSCTTHGPGEQGLARARDVAVGAPVVGGAGPGARGGGRGRGGFGGRLGDREGEAALLDEARDAVAVEVARHAELDGGALERITISRFVVVAGVG